MIESNPIRPVPQQRIREKVDACMSRKDYAGVERVLLYWLDEAEAGGDMRGRLMILGELVGHYRKTHEAGKIHQRADEALRLVEALDYGNAISGATAFVNIATAYNSLDENDLAIPLFERAREIYEASPGTAPQLIGGLYNNMGLCYAALGRQDEAIEVYQKALEVMQNVPGGAADQAITCLNMANALEARDGMENAEHEVFRLLDEADAYLGSPDLPHDSYYAYVCEHCAPTFEYYGYFAAAQKYRKEAETIYDRS